MWISRLLLYIALLACIVLGSVFAQPNTSIHPVDKQFQQATSFFKDTPVQIQDYVILDSANVFEVTEYGEFIEDDSYLAYSHIQLIDSVYQFIEIALIKNKIDTITHTIVQRGNNNMYFAYHNGQLSDTLAVPNQALFGGPNPYYDFVNCMLHDEQENSEANVILIDWSDGTLLPSTWEIYTPTEDSYTIAKKNSDLMEIEYSIPGKHLMTVTEGEMYYIFEQLYAPPQRH